MGQKCAIFGPPCRHRHSSR